MAPKLITVYESLGLYVIEGGVLLGFHNVKIKMEVAMPKRLARMLLI